jgi:hypothetical protein
MSMWEAPPHRKKRMVDLAGFFRAGTKVLPEAAAPSGSPKQAVADAARKERRLKAEPNSGAGGFGFMTKGMGWRETKDSQQERRAPTLETLAK